VNCGENGKGDEKREEHVEKLRQTLFENGPQGGVGRLSQVGPPLRLQLLLVQQLVVPIESLQIEKSTWIKTY